MQASALHQVLIDHANVEHSQLNQVFERLPAAATVADYRSALVKAGILPYSTIMRLFFTHGLALKAKTVIKKIQNQRDKQVHFKPAVHEQKFKITEDDVLSPTIALASDLLTLNIPPPKADDLAYSHSDERQAVQLAVDIAKQGDAKDAEQILLETLDTFKHSSAAMQSLCWLYLSTAHGGMVQRWAKKELAIHPDNPYTLELLSMTEQVLGKHFLASAHYQKLLKQARVKPIWYLLLALSQDYGACHRDANENYKIYLRIGKDERIKSFAEQQLKRLSHL